MAFAPLAATSRLLAAPQDDQREVNWGLKDIGKLLGLSLLYSLLADLLLGPVFRVFALDTVHLRPTLAELISLALLYLTHTRYRFWPSASYFGLTIEDFRSKWKRGVYWGIVIKFGMGIAGMLGIAILMLVFGGESSLLELPSRLRVQPELRPLLWLTDSLRAVVIAPLTEELLCRGMLYGWLRSKYGLTAGRIISSLVFAALHGSVAVLLPTFFVGFGLVLLYERTKSLAPCVVAHGTGNLISVMLSALF